MRRGLTELRDQLTKAQLLAYDNLNVCYESLADRILAVLPNNDHILLPSAAFPDNPFQQVWAVFMELFSQQGFDVRSCAWTQAPSTVLWSA
eukprot:jgi/Chrzof1/14017/Cz08g21080.t1